jgi:hypothetical protein
LQGFCSNRIEKIKTVSDWLSRAAALPAQLCANAVPQAIDSVTRVSNRVEFVESEFNGTGAQSPYIQYQVSASDAASR